MGVDTSKVSFGEMVAGVAGAVLLIDLWLPWYGIEAEGGGFDLNVGNINAWESFGLIDLLLFIVALLAIGLAVARATGSMPANLPAPPGMIVAGAGALAALLVLFRLLAVPDPSETGDAVDLSRKIGAFIGLIASGAVAFGGWTAMNERASGVGSPPAAGPGPGTGAGPGTGTTAPPPPPPPSSEPPPPGSPSA